MSRQSSITDSDTPGTTDAAYTYLGLDKIVVEDYVQTQTKLTYRDDLSGAVTGSEKGIVPRSLGEEDNEHEVS